MTVSHYYRPETPTAIEFGEGAGRAGFSFWAGLGDSNAALSLLGSRRRLQLRLESARISPGKGDPALAGGDPDPFMREGMKDTELEKL